MGALIFWSASLRHQPTLSSSDISLPRKENIWSFALTWNVVEQILTYGPRNVFAVVAALVSFSCLLTIPLYIYGKRIRSFVHRNLKFNEEDELSAVAH